MKTFFCSTYTDHICPLSAWKTFAECCQTPSSLSLPLSLSLSLSLRLASLPLLFRPFLLLTQPTPMKANAYVRDCTLLLPLSILPVCIPPLFLSTLNSFLSSACNSPYLPIFPNACNPLPLCLPLSMFHYRSVVAVFVSHCMPPLLSVPTSLSQSLRSSILWFW